MKTLDSIKKDLSPARRRKIESLTHHLIAEEMTRQPLRRARRRLPCRLSLRELAAFNTGLCVISTRTPFADIADHERTSVLCRNPEQLSSDAGAKLLRALASKGIVKRLVDEFEASGSSSTAFCRSRGLALSTLRRHRNGSRLGSETRSPGRRLVAVSVVPSSRDRRPNRRLERRGWYYCCGEQAGSGYRGKAGL